MISKQQLILIQSAKRDLVRMDSNFDDAQYRIILRSIAGVESSKDLDNRTFEQVLGFFETLGWIDQVHGKGYWSAKAARYSRHEITDREIHMIEDLAAQQSYDLAGLIGRLTGHRTTDIQQLSSVEAHKVIEALKDIVSREAAKTRNVSINHQPSTVPATVLTEAEVAQIEQDSNIPF